MEDKSFNSLVKEWFMRIFALKLQHHYSRHQEQLDGYKYKIVKGQISIQDINQAK